MDKVFTPVIIILILQIAKNSVSTAVGSSTCPIDCICYSEYLSNLASWKWVENDIGAEKDEMDHRDFNPYTETNDVMENPIAHKLRQTESTLHTVTCIIRKDVKKSLLKTLQSVPASTQILSLIQAAGSENLTLERAHFENLYSLVGLEVQGYSNQHAKDEISSFNMAADAFQHLKKLTYLNLENVNLLQKNVENKFHDVPQTLLRINYTTDEDINNEISSQLLVLTPSGRNSANTIVPYSVYKSESRGSNGISTNQNPVEPKIAVGFTGLSNLNHLRISGCKLEDISWDMFLKLQNLKFLLLESNNLLFLPDFVFYATSNLTALSLARNRILNLQTVGLAGLLYLQKLDVSYNNITHLSELSLPPFPHLEVADFRYNPIETIFPNTFEVMNTTKTLYLGDPTKQLEFFPNSFYGLISLTRLDIMNVRIAFLERPMLKGMPKLKSLTMEGVVKKVSYDAFSEVSNLEKLVLRKCSIRKISMDAFYGLRSLIQLDLSYNDLSFLPPGLLDEQLSLREVSLNHNQLTTLPTNLFKYIPAKMVRLDMNPWHCSCDMISWNPDIINQVKRLFIAQNSTFCQRQYDKGSMCAQSAQPTFQVKYVYEKRVSPLCGSPQKFSGTNVFVVLRKELQYCTSSRVSTAHSPNNNTAPVPIISTTTPHSIVNRNLKKEIERQLLMTPRPVKVKKPIKITTTSVTSTTIQSTSQTFTNTTPNNVDFNITSGIQVPSLINELPRISVSITAETTTEILTTRQPTKPSKSRIVLPKPTKPTRAVNEIRNQPGTNAALNRAAISRKALKLAKLLKMQRTG